MCFILQVTQGTAPDMNPPDVPAFCAFCERPEADCHCDERGFTLSDFGRITLFAPVDPVRAAVRAAYKQAGNNGSNTVCSVLRGILPELKDEGEPETCSACGGNLPDECYCGYDFSPDMNRYGVHSAI